MGAGAGVVLPLTACVAPRSTLETPEGHQPKEPATSSPTSPTRATTETQPSNALPRDAASNAASPNAASSSKSTSHQGPASQKPPARSASLSCERIVAKIGRNHGHAFPIAAEDVRANTPKTFDLRGDSDHAHSIELSAEDLAALCRGEVVRKQTERGGANAHRHRVLLRCEPLVLPPEMVSACDILVAGKDDHELVIPESHVRAGIERHYDIQGVAGHTHVLTVTPSDFQRIATGENVDLTSGQGLGHFHHVYIRYPAA